MAANEYNVPVPHDRQTIACLYCNKPMEIGSRTLSATCKYCHKPLRFENVRVDKYDTKTTLATYGNVVVEKKGNMVVTNRIYCGGMVIRGKVKGHITSRGPVLVGPEAEIKGDVTAPTLAVGAGAILEGNYHIGQPEPNARSGNP